MKTRLFLLATAFAATAIADSVNPLDPSCQGGFWHDTIIMSYTPGQGWSQTLCYGADYESILGGFTPQGPGDTTNLRFNINYQLTFEARDLAQVGQGHLTDPASLAANTVTLNSAVLSGDFDRFMMYINGSSPLNNTEYHLGLGFAGQFNDGTTHQMSFDWTTPTGVPSLAEMLSAGSLHLDIGDFTLADPNAPAAFAVELGVNFQLAGVEATGAPVSVPDLFSTGTGLACVCALLAAARRRFAA